MKKAEGVLELIGSTPMVKLSEGPDQAALWAKLEFLNPGGSVKDRICRRMIEKGQAEGRIGPETTIIEPTSGNTGISLALVCAAKRLRLILTLPETVPAERRTLLAAFGARVELTPGVEGMRGAVRRAEEMAGKNGKFFLPHQFRNRENPQAHRDTTAQEILAQCRGTIDAFVCGVGTGGTITGVGEVLKERLGGVSVVAVEPAQSAVLSGGNPGPHGILGIGPGFIPPALNRSVIDRVVPVQEEEARQGCLVLAQKEGLWVGPSSGAAFFAARQVARALGRGKNVVVLFPDGGDRYPRFILEKGEKAIRSFPREARRRKSDERGAE